MIQPGTVSVILVNWNRAELTQKALDSLARQQTDTPFTVVVVDNGSSDDSADVLAAANPSVTLVRETVNRGFGAGANAGIAAAESEIVVLLNNDAEAESNFVSNISRSLISADASVAAITGHLVLAGTWSKMANTENPAAAEGHAGAARQAAGLVAHDGSTWQLAPHGIVLTNSTGNVVGKSGNGSDRDWLEPHPAHSSPVVFGFSGGAVALRRNALNAVGGFDESLFMYYEDTDLSWRLRRAGFDIRYDKDAIVYHQHAGSSGVGSDLFLRANARNRLVIATLHGPSNMIVRAFAHTLARAIRMTLQRVGERAAINGALLDYLRLLPNLIHRRRVLNRQAVVSRAAVVAEFIRD